MNNNDFPMVTIDCVHRNVTYVIPRDSVRQAQSHKEDPSQTFVTFENPNDDDGPSVLFATVDMPVVEFRDKVLRPAWIPEVTTPKKPRTVRSKAS